MKKTFLLLLAVSLALSLLASCGKTSDQSAGASQSGNGSQSEGGSQPARDTAAALGSLSSFTAYTLEQESFTQDDIKAKDVTVVNFWSTTCGPCIVEMPELAGFAKAMPGNVQVITICLDGYGNEEAAAGILQQSGFEGVTLIAGDGDLQALCQNLMYTPTTVFADSEGRLVGGAIIGGQKDLSAAFLEAVNEVLTASGKETSLDDEA